MSIKQIVRDVGVDAGMVMIGDLGFSKEVKKFGFNKVELKRLGKTFDIPTGNYKVSWKVVYDEDVMNEYDILEGNGILTVSSGNIFVVDPCYVIGTKGDKWCDWLNATDYGRNFYSDKAFLLDSIRDDGGYDIEFIFTKIV